MSTSQLFSDIRNMFTPPPQQQPVSASESQKGGVPSSRRKVSNIAKVSKKNLQVIKNIADKEGISIDKLVKHLKQGE